MADRDCPSWCNVHSATRCRSAPMVVEAWQGHASLLLGCQLEQRLVTPVLSLLLPDAAPILVPPPGVAVWWGRVGQLVDAAGWAAVQAGR